MEGETKEPLLAGEEVDKYDKYAGYTNKQSFHHHIAHILGTTLAQNNHLMDFEYAKSNMLENRIAGYEAEFSAMIYEHALRRHPANVLFGCWQNPSKLRQKFIDHMKGYAEIDLSNTNEIENLIRTTESDDKSQKQHLEMRLKYAKHFNNIQWPSVKEIEYHIKKAEKFCDHFKEKHGKYPSQFKDYELAKMPLSDFAIDHEFPLWLKKEWAQQKAIWDYKTNPEKEKSWAVKKIEEKTNQPKTPFI